MDQDDLKGLLSTIDAYEASAYGSDEDGGELAHQRSLAIDAYQGKNIEPQPEGRSQVTDWTVFETIQWIIPSLIRIFASGDDVVEFEPFGPEDEESSEQESQFLNHLVTQKNNWFLTCLTWIQDALLTKNAYCMAFMEEVKRTEVESYKGQSEDQVALLLDDDVEVVGQRIYPDPEHNPEPELDPQTGEPMIDMETMQPAMTVAPNLIDIKLRRTKAKKKLSYKVLPPERCKVDGNCTDFTLDNCDYFEYWDNTSISDLRRMGYDVSDDVGDDADWDTLEDNSRDDMLAHNFENSDNPDKSTRRVKARWIWAAHDYDDDGIAEMLHVVRVGNEILMKKDDEDNGISQVSTIPVASIVPLINTHRHMGTSIADLVFDIQRIKTAILRQGLDSLYFANNPRPIASNKVDMDDLLVSSPGSPIRIDTDMPDVQGHVSTLPMPFVFPQAQEGLRHMDTVTEARAGVNRMFQGIDESNVNDHNRIGQLSSMAAQRVEMIARVMANGFERLFRISHELIIKSGHKAETIRLTGKWVEFDPSQWKTGRDMKVVAPFAAGNKDSLLQRLMMLRGIHSEAAAAGHPMVQPDDSYALAQEIAWAADLPDYKFFTDPSTVPPPQPGPDHTMLALEIEDKKVENEATDEARQAELDMHKVTTQAELDRYKADLDARVKLAIAGAKDESQLALEETRFRLKNEPIELANDEIRAANDAAQRAIENLEAVTKSVMEMQEAANAPIEIVKDKKGKVIGKRQGGKFTELKR